MRPPRLVREVSPPPVPTGQCQGKQGRGQAKAEAAQGTGHVWKQGGGHRAGDRPCLRSNRGGTSRGFGRLRAAFRQAGGAPRGGHHPSNSGELMTGRISDCPHSLVLVTVPTAWCPQPAKNWGESLRPSDCWQQSLPLAPDCRFDRLRTKLKVVPIRTCYANRDDVS